MEKHGDFKQLELAVSKWSKTTQSDGQAGKWITKELLKTKEGWTKFHGLNIVIIIDNNLSVLVLQVLGTAPYNLTTEADDRECVAMGHFKRPGSNQPGSQGGGSEANSR